MNQVRSMAGQGKKMQSATQVAQRRRAYSPDREPVQRVNYVQSRGGKFQRRPGGEEFQEPISQRGNKGYGKAAGGGDGGGQGKGGKKRQRKIFY